MPEFTLNARSVFEVVGGCRIDVGGVVFDEAPARSLVSLAARRGRAEALTAAVEKATRSGFGWRPLTGKAQGDPPLVLPGRGMSSTGAGALAIFSAPGQWLVSAPRATLMAELREMAGAQATLTDQSDAFVAFDLSGPGARDVLRRLSTLDFDDAAFRPGAAARTPMQQIAVVVVRLADDAGGPRYRLETARSTARSFAHDVAVAARAVAKRAHAGAA